MLFQTYMTSVGVADLQQMMGKDKNNSKGLKEKENYNMKITDLNFCLYGH